MTDTETIRHDDWALRPWALAVLLGLAGLGVHLVAQWDADWWTPWRAALTAALAFGPLAFAFTLDRDRWRAPLAFAALVALVMAGIAWRVASVGDRHADAPFWFAAGVVAIALALPLFQAGFHRLRWRTPYDATHFHVWTDAISVAGALAFTGLAWLLLYLLALLFGAIDIHVLRHAIEEGWFGWTFSGAAFGGSLGVLRNQLKIIGTLQSVVMLVFSIIAVPLALGLTIFLVAVLASGIAVLWNATESPTPLLLSVAVASFVLVNAVVRNGEEEASGNRVLRWAALALALSILPLALLAAISTGTRIAEYGLSPERIWGVIAVAVAYGLAYFVAPIRGRIAGWMARVRTANMHLAVGTCVLAFVLALPLFDFGAISARNQIARLESGEVTVEKFDFEALRWDFGDAGRDALALLAKSSHRGVAERALAAANAQLRSYETPDVRRQRSSIRVNLVPDTAANREMVFLHLETAPWLCSNGCVAVELFEWSDGLKQFAIIDSGSASFTPVNLPRELANARHAQPADRPKRYEFGSKVEIRQVEGRQIYVDSEPFGEMIALPEDAEGQ